MAAGQTNNPGGTPGQKNLSTVLVPVIGVALIVVLVVIVAATNDGTQSTDKDGKGGATVTSGPGQPMPSDGSNGGTDDPDLKPIGTEGLKYRDLKEGTGPECPKGATVVCHYTGWLTTGKVFDSSRDRGEPTEFSLNQVVPGWQQGIPGMKVGGIRKLVIPAALGYGARGSPPKIPGGATLIFEVELVSIK